MKDRSATAQLDEVNQRWTLMLQRIIDTKVTVLYLLYFLPRDACSAKHGIAIVSRPSVCPSVMLMYAEHIS